MKNLAKVLMSFVVVMLLSVSVFANGDTVDPVAPANQTGKVTLEVAEYLVFDLVNAEMKFDFNKLTGLDPNAKTTRVKVQSNVNWTVGVAVVDSGLEGVADLGIGVLKINGAPMSMTVPVTEDGTMTANVDFRYKFAITGNPVPGTYVTNLLYSVVKR